MTRVLFVEDDEHWAQKFVRCLTLSGFAVKYVSSVDEAIAATREEDFEFVVTDIMMDPGKLFSNEETSDGFATGLFLARAIHANFPETQIIALSNVDKEKLTNFH